MKEIELTNGAKTIVDDIDYEWLSQFKWSAVRCSSRSAHFRAVRSDRDKIAKKQIHLIMSRVIMDAKKGETVDHINSNPLDNRRENLRICTQAENCRNYPAKKNSQTGLKGVCYKWTYNKWVFYARININYKRIDLGYYKTAEEAAHAYDEATIKYHGPFARLNYPRD
jgi:hypothetical protein